MWLSCGCKEGVANGKVTVHDTREEARFSCTCRNDLEKRSRASRAVVSWLSSEPEVPAWWWLSCLAASSWSSARLTPARGLDFAPLSCLPEAGLGCRGSPKVCVMKSSSC